MNATRVNDHEREHDEATPAAEVTVRIARTTNAATGQVPGLGRRQVGDLTPAEREQLGIGRNVDELSQEGADAAYLCACQDVTYWDQDGQELQVTDVVVLAPQHLPAAKDVHAARRARAARRSLLAPGRGLGSGPEATPW